MMKKLIFLVSIITLCSLTVSADEATYESGIFKYIIQKNGIRITSCMDYNSETIEIPSEIDGLPVVSVGGFSGNSRKVKNVIVPEGVTEIVEMAFYYCNTLEKISLPTTLTTIGKSAFYNCDSLTELHIPENVSSLGEEGSFRNCFNLPAITVDEKNQWFSSLDGVLYSKDKSILYMYPAGKKDETFIIPEGVLKLNNYCFYSCDLETITIPENLQSIGINIFCYCDNLKRINFKGSNEEWANIKVADNNDFSKFEINCDEIVSDKYIITYHTNGSKEYIKSTVSPIGQSTNITHIKPTYNNNSLFLGWATTIDSTTPVYYPGDVYTKNENISLYAIYTYAELGGWVNISGGGGNSGGNGGSGTNTTTGFTVDLHNCPLGSKIIVAKYLDDKFVTCEIRDYTGKQELYIINTNFNKARIFVWENLNINGLEIIKLC